MQVLVGGELLHERVVGEQRLDGPKAVGELLGQTLDGLLHHLGRGTRGLLEAVEGLLPLALRGRIGGVIEVGEGVAGLLQGLGGDAELGELVLDALGHLVEQLLAQLGGQIRSGLHGLLEVREGALHIARLELLEGLDQLRSGLARLDEVLRREANLLQLRLDARVLAQRGERGVTELVIADQLTHGTQVRGVLDELTHGGVERAVVHQLLHERLVREQRLGDAVRQVLRQPAHGLLGDLRRRGGRVLQVPERLLVVALHRGLRGLLQVRRGVVAGHHHVLGRQAQLLQRARLGMLSGFRLLGRRGGAEHRLLLAALAGRARLGLEAVRLRLHLVGLDLVLRRLGARLLRLGTLGLRRILRLRLDLGLIAIIRPVGRTTTTDVADRHDVPREDRSSRFGSPGREVAAPPLVGVIARREFQLPKKVSPREESKETPLARIIFPRWP
ncbi:hypothetical protein DB31_3984 [Hyalangium minutum]|uniref:Uncharacterized protein n=1 Tax=Hyalangium minutum TaxID=394096 RepID=A0A085W4D7_9BACT|nr:hypothetical protein DB31_3984 [Hyalangium minutum]